MAKQKRNKSQYKKQVLQDTPQDAKKEFYRRVLMMQEEEKRRISRDLHDETGQIVIALGAQLNLIEKELKEGNAEKATMLINENRKLVFEIANRMKSMALNLRPPALDILGLPAVLRDYFSQCTKSDPIKITFNENIKDKKLDKNMEIALYRIIQEATYNIIRHSTATTVKVDLILEDKKLKLFIEDNGKGFNVEEYQSQQDLSKMGLRSIKERVDVLNGTFSIESGSGKGTKLAIVLSLQEDIWQSK